MSSSKHNHYDHVIVSLAITNVLYKHKFGATRGKKNIKKSTVQLKQTLINII